MNKFPNAPTFVKLKEDLQILFNNSYGNEQQAPQTYNKTRSEQHAGNTITKDKRSDKGASYSQTTYDIIDEAVNDILLKKGANEVTTYVKEVLKNIPETNIIVNKVISSFSAPSFNLGFSLDKPPEKVEVHDKEK
ncbi:hypothetical protein L6452_22292 [Arctium lappa]|uniref:Uncharacterized protein n=1 Tax=Arctium lappa TaxID=4217 RepID=A0ACB9B049_ARCLA|nr:hypothetical protein L6452_22292 [Arctium lappa]